MGPGQAHVSIINIPADAAVPLLQGFAMVSTSLMRGGQERQPRGRPVDTQSQLEYLNSGTSCESCCSPLSIPVARSRNDS